MKFAVAIALLIASASAATCIGAVSITPLEVWNGLLHRGGSVNGVIVWDIRFPRVVLAALVGAALSIAGASYQSVFRNPLADPYLLGAAAGAGIGATLAIGYLNEPELVTLLAFIGALAGVAAAWTVGSAAGGLQTSAVMVLSGVAVMSFLTAVQTVLQQQRSDSLQQVYSWILGQLASGGWSSAGKAAPGMAIGSLVLLLYARKLDVFELGDDKARSLGIHIARDRIIIVLAASLATASAVAVSGLIGFVGLVVPHIVRRVAGVSNQIVLPMCIITGATFLVLTDLLARTIVAPAELPIGVITAFLGAPFFAWLLYRTRGKWST